MKFYVDTSVWGGHDNDEFEEWTIPFFDIRTPKEVMYENES